MRILNSCVIYKLQTVNPGFPPSPPHTFWSTAIRRDIRAALYFAVVNCADAAFSAFFSPVLTRCRIFLQLWTVAILEWKKWGGHCGAKEKSREANINVKYCRPKVICCMGQSSELEREIKQKSGGESGGASQKSGGAMASPGPPLESPLVMNFSVLALSVLSCFYLLTCRVLIISLCSLQWHMSACRIICTGTPENGGMTGALYLLLFQKAGNGGGGAFHITVS